MISPLIKCRFVDEGRSSSKADGSRHTTIYGCSCQARDECCGEIKVTAQTVKVYDDDDGVVCRKTSVHVGHP